MRFIATMTAIMLIGSACASTSDSSDSAKAKSSQPLSEKEAGTLQAFEDICLSALPGLTVDAATLAAKKYDIDLKESSNGKYGGFSTDGYRAVQFKPGESCVITSEDIDKPVRATAAFKEKINSRFSDVNTIPKSRSQLYNASIQDGDNRYKVMHDTTGGELFLIMKMQ